MKLWLKVGLGLVGTAGLALAGCNSAPGGEEMAESSKMVSFACPDGAMIEVQYPADGSDQVTVTLPAQDPVALARVEAASGAKYSDGSLTFWEKGGEAMVEAEGQPLYSGCMAQE